MRGADDAADGGAVTQLTLDDALLPKVTAIVRAWSSTTATELTAARAMYEIAKLLGIEAPKPVAPDEEITF